MNSRTIKILVSIVLLLHTIGSLHANDLLDNANRSLDYLRKNVIYADLDQFSEEETVAAIRSLSLALNHVDLTKESVVLIKRIRVSATHSVNSKRSYGNRPIDVSLSMRAIKDVEFILKEEPGSANASLLYSAGHIALHHVKDTVLAYDFWNQCAEMRHAGCMNTIAAESFTGMNGLPIDTDNSILWHKRVFETGIKFNCAGVYSAHMLSTISFFFPKLETSGDWKFWREQRDSLLEEIELKPDNKNLCPKDSFYLQDYTFDTAAGNPDNTILYNAISATEEGLIIDVLESINRDVSLPETLSLVENVTNNYQQCDLTFNLLMLSKYKNKTEMAGIFEDHLYSLDRVACSDQLGIIQRLRDQGRWELNQED